MSSAASTLVFPSVEWFQALQQLVNVDPEFRRLGSIDAAMGVKVGSRVFVVVFEAFECTEVRDGSEADLDDLDFYLELSEADWRELVENTKANGGAWVCLGTSKMLWKVL
jgi:phytoene dehydrogenase-like protein